MFTYSIEFITGILKEVCAKYTMTRHFVIGQVHYVAKKEHYVVTLGDNSRHHVPKETVNTYIESFGEKSGLKIAGLLSHNIELEESARREGSKEAGPDDFWDGDIDDVDRYLEKKDKQSGEGSG